MKKKLFYITNPRKLLLALSQKKLIYIPDKLYLKLMFKERIGAKLNLKDPKTFNEKLQWLKLYDHNISYVNMVDKCEAKKYVADMIGNEYIIPTLGIYNNFDEINFDDLPAQFVIKTTHDSGGYYICDDKSKLNIETVKEKINSSLKNNYYLHGREWPYKMVKPRIIIEKYMDFSGDGLKDYKFMCFNGQVKCTFVCTERFSKEGLHVTFFDLNWNKMPFERYYPASDKKIEKPQCYEKMITLAEKLSKDIPFVRVDFYEVNGKCYFGELTFYPGNGFEYFKPKEWDEKLGNWLILPKR